MSRMCQRARFLITRVVPQRCGLAIFRERRINNFLFQNFIDNSPTLNLFLFLFENLLVEITASADTCDFADGARKKK